MDLAYLTGQRVTDVRMLDERDVRVGQIWIKQAKTNVKRRVEIIGELAVLIDRIKARKAGHKVRSTRLIVTADGSPMMESMLRGGGRATWPGRRPARTRRCSRCVTCERRQVLTRLNRAAIFAKHRSNLSTQR